MPKKASTDSDARRVVGRAGIVLADSCMTYVTGSTKRRKLRLKFVTEQQVGEGSSGPSTGLLKTIDLACK